MTDKFRLTVWDTNFKKVGTIERPAAEELLAFGKVIQKAFGAYYRLELPPRTEGPDLT